MKKVVWFLVLLLGFNLVSAYSFHSASEIYLEVDGNDMNLQQAYTNGLLTGGHTYSVPTKIVFGHPIDKVIISTDSGEMTLLDALNNNVKIIGSSQTYSIVASTDEHYATEINFSDGSTLQEVINSGDVCTPDTSCVGLPSGSNPDGCGGSFYCAPPSTYSWYKGSWSSNNACPAVFTRSVYCKRSDGTNMGSTCGTYEGCDCPKPDNKVVKNCYWGLLKDVCDGCNSYSLVSNGDDTKTCWNTRCRDLSTCTSRNAITYCTTALNCDCGTSCSAYHARKFQCFMPSSP